MSFTSPESTPACTAAPTATTSSGFTVRFGSLPKKFFTVSMIFGMRVCPPTRTTSSICDGCSFASARHLRVGSMERSTSSSTIASSFARLSLIERCFGPVWSAVRNGRLISLSIIEESSIFAFSAASLRRCSTILSFETSMPVSLRNSVMSHSMMRWSMLSPPRCVSPFVASTSTTFSPTSRIEMSKVPPPKS